jgi:hypothetical protein
MEINGQALAAWALSNLHDTMTTEDMATMADIGQRMGQEYPQILSSSRPLCLTAKTNFLATPVEWACDTPRDPPIAVRRQVRWRIESVDTRPTIFEDVVSNDIPPRTVILSLDSRNIDPGEQTHQLNELLRDRYEALGWPPELVIHEERCNRRNVLFWLSSRRVQVLHIAGHMGGDGLQLGDDRIDPITLTNELQESDVRLIVLNGCEGGRPTSPVAVSYLTLAERLVRDGRIPEVIAHRNEISESDALAFAKGFHTKFFDSKDGFDAARAAFEGRRAGSERLRYSPVVISQREVQSPPT